MKNKFLTDEQRLRLYVVMRLLGDEPYNRIQKSGYFLTYDEISFVINGDVSCNSRQSIYFFLIKGKRVIKRRLSAFGYDEGDF